MSPLSHAKNESDPTSHPNGKELMRPLFAYSLDKIRSDSTPLWIYYECAKMHLWNPIRHNVGSWKVVIPLGWGFLSSQAWPEVGEGEGAGFESGVNDYPIASY
jgi:hypothetical protein